MGGDDWKARRERFKREKGGEVEDKKVKEEEEEGIGEADGNRSREEVGGKVERKRSRGRRSEHDE